MVSSSFSKRASTFTLTTLTATLTPTSTPYKLPKILIYANVINTLFS